jgi:hypothetical protein
MIGRYGCSHYIGRPLLISITEQGSLLQFHLSWIAPHLSSWHAALLRVRAGTFRSPALRRRSAGY